MEKYICYHCKKSFEMPASLPGDEQDGVRCPGCGSIQFEKSPSWLPEGYKLDAYLSPSEWEYKCHQCNTIFKLPVPSGPTEEEQIKCPACSSTDIERLTALVFEHSLHCG